MSTGKALSIVLAVIIVVGAYLGLATWLHVVEYWVGFLFLLQWSMMEEMKVDRLPKSALGAAAGIAIASLPAWLAPAIGVNAALAVLTVAALVATFLLIKGVAGLVINPATMVFLTVATIPHVARGATPLGLYLGLGLGLAFFGGLALVALAVRSKVTPATEVPGFAA
jgi:hypothetical protein